jgi:hypothetical protein
MKGAGKKLIGKIGGVIACCATLITTGVVKAQTMPYPEGRVFPLALYEVAGDEVPQLESYGWNIFQTYGLSDTNDCHEYVETLATDKADTLTAIPCFGKKTNKVEWPAAKVQQWIKALAGNPNIAWWDLPEEMRPWMESELKLLGDYTALTRANDPQRRPTYEYTPNNRNAAQIAGVVPRVDIIGLSCYCEAYHMPHAWVRYKVQESGLHGIALAGATPGGDYLHGQKIPVAVLYCAKDDKADTVATPDEMYHDFWSAIVSGAQGIAVYAYHHAQNDDPALPDNFQRLNEAASQISGPERIGDVILWGRLDPNVNVEILTGPERTVQFRPSTEKKYFQYPSINLLSKAWNGSLYVIAVNSTDQAIKSQITGLPASATTATLPFESRTVQIGNGAFTDSFGPWKVHIYKIALAN